MPFFHSSLPGFIEEMRQITASNLLYIYGAGEFGTFLTLLFANHQVPIEGFIESQLSDYQSHFFMGKKVLPVAKADSSCRYLISSLRYREAMRKNLIENGVPEDRIIAFQDYTIINDAIVDVLKPQAYSRKINRYADLHKADERCFIIGNGPSLQIRDLEKLSGCTTFAANNMLEVFRHSSWTPTYYFISDLDLSKKLFSSRQQVEYMCGHCAAFFAAVWGSLYRYRDDPAFTNLFFFTERICSNDAILFSEDVSAESYGYYTILYHMLQFAVYMGFRKIYLLGVDHTFSNYQKSDGTVIQSSAVKRNHADFMSDYQTADAARLPQADKVENAYKAAHAYAEAHGIKIYNATRGGRLEIFERVDFDSLF